MVRRSSPARSLHPEHGAANKIQVKARTISQPIGLVENAGRRLAELIAPLLEQTPLACQPGCAWCCHLYVIFATIPEVLAIAEHLRRTLTEAELADLRQRVTVTLERKRNQSRFQPAAPMIPCPLLVDNLCSVYEFRPLVCRAWHSTDVRRCQQPNGSLAVNQEVMQVFSAIYRSLIATLAEQELESQEVELISALDIALNTPDAAQRWLAGETLFAAAAASPVVTKLAV